MGIDAAYRELTTSEGEAIEAALVLIRELVHMHNRDFTYVDALKLEVLAEAIRRTLDATMYDSRVWGGGGT